MLIIPVTQAAAGMIVKAAARAGFNAASESFAESVKSTIGMKNNKKAISRAIDDLPKESFGRTLSFCPLFMKTQRMRGITIRTRAISMSAPPHNILYQMTSIPHRSPCCLGTLVPIFGIEPGWIQKGSALSTTLATTNPTHPGMFETNISNNAKLTNFSFQ
jgi:hypothetical protein